MLAICDQVDWREFQDANTLVRHKLDSAMDDAAYRDYVLARNRRISLALPAVSEEYRELHAAAVLVGNTYEELGILAKNNIIERNILLDQYSLRIVNTFDAMHKWLAWARAASGDSAIGENFEYLTVLAEDFKREHPSSYPVGVRRLPLDSPWPVPPMSATA